MMALSHPVQLDYQEFPLFAQLGDYSVIKVYVRCKSQYLRDVYFIQLRFFCATDELHSLDVVQQVQMQAATT